jgi:predicted metal-dependent phosphoesterase TrpH
MYTGDAAVCAAWLHDVLEDTAETREGLVDAGFSTDVVSAVEALTRTTAVADDDYYRHIREVPIALLVKTADIAHNRQPDRVAKLKGDTREKLKLKYDHALDVLGVDPSIITALHARWAWENRDALPTGPLTRDPVTIDLHSHSNRSDGTDTPHQLVQKASDQGITVLAITDHDTTAGWSEAGEAALRTGVRLVRGLELSVKNEGRSQHLLAYEPDPNHPTLVEMLRRARVVREARIPLMVERIAATVPGLRWEDVRALAQGASPGRPHIADRLVALKVCRDRSEAFQRYLIAGCDTYVARWAPPIEDAIRVIGAAGGATVVAHPWGGEVPIKSRRFEQLKACGLVGVEVDHIDHDERARRELRGVARELDLIVTGSSDHHGSARPERPMACCTTDRDQFERLESLWSRPAPVKELSTTG